MARLRIGLLALLAAVATVAVAPTAPVAATTTATTADASVTGVPALLGDLTAADFATLDATDDANDAAAETADNGDATADAAADAADVAEAASDAAAPATLDTAARQWREHRAARRRARAAARRAREAARRARRRAAAARRRARAAARRRAAAARRRAAAARRRARRNGGTTCLVRSGGWYTHPRWAPPNGLIVYFRNVVTGRVAADGSRIGGTRTVVKAWECYRRWGRWPVSHTCVAAGEVSKLCAGNWRTLPRFQSVCNRGALRRTWVRPAVPAEDLIKCDDVPAPSPEW